jgi:hypothetical protein
LRNAESIYLKDGVFFIRVFIDFLNTGAMWFLSNIGTTNTGDNQFVFIILW